MVAGYLRSRTEVNRANGIVGAVVEIRTGYETQALLYVNSFGKKYKYQHFYSLPIQILIAPLKVRLLLLPST